MVECINCHEDVDKFIIIVTHKPLIICHDCAIDMIRVHLTSMLDSKEDKT